MLVREDVQAHELALELGESFHGARQKRVRRAAPRRANGNVAQLRLPRGSDDSADHQALSQAPVMLVAGDVRIVIAQCR